MKGRKTRAVTLMLLSSLSFSIMQVFVKMSSAEVGTFEQVFFRNLISMIVAGITVHKAKIDLIPEMKKGGLTLWGRSFFGFLGIVLFFYATSHARQADVAMLNRASPVFVTIFAGPILKEKISRVQVCAVALCLMGAYISMQPSFDSNPLPLMCALGAAMVAGLAYTLLSYTKRFTSAPVIIFHFSLLSTVCAGVMMIPSFVVPSPKVVVMLLLVGLFAAGGQYLLTYAYQQAPASEVSIYQYSGVVFTALLSYLIFKETLNATSILGAIVILTAIFWVFEYSKRKTVKN
ncbi:DMT family transporter [Dysosmobacter sp.]|jgi:drug/metabolite transporter (DMT)-like permease|uniref:DMT family transporter n=1 Tax=Dysosmobacter sp. TaxID=2591382 RepID=UPI002A833925|nr:DMT family transporter [Dysosmobacter sp.]MCI7215461.1 DMT family transporter [Dysosmobacter sp.]MDY3653935.1 DMT family transporter [Dysosmobacter sp.]